MENNTIEVTLAGVTVPCRLRYAETARYFAPPDPAAQRAGGDPIYLSDEDWRYFLANNMEDCAHSEYSILTAAFSDALMPFDRVILHAVAIRWRDKAYLISAPSGTGKSTQFKHLNALRPGEFSVICGDRPVLQFCHSEQSEESVPPVPTPQSCHSERPEGLAVRHSEESASTSQSCHSERSEESASPVPTAAAFPVPEVIVHPSPWNGKENWHGADAAPLGGIILLRRGEENRLEAAQPREIALELYAQFIQTAADPDKIRKVAELETRMLESVPLWRLTTNTVPDSTRLLLESVFPE